MKLKFSNEWLQQKIENEQEGLTVEAGALELTSDEFALLCENPPSYQALELEIKLLKAELKQKDEKLSEFQNGLPIEKAKELDEVLIMDWEQSSSDGQLWRSYKKAEVAVVKWTVVPFLNWAGEHHWFDENNGVIYKNPKAFFAPPVLPSTETQMEGE